MTAILALLPALAMADFADFVDTAKEATRNTFTAPKPVPTQLSFTEHMLTFWDRNSPYDFKFEFLALLLIAGYVGLYFVGKEKNEKIAREKFQSIYRQLYDNFALVGVKQGAAPLAKDGTDLFLSYVSGRKNVAYGHITIQTLPRADLLVGYTMKSVYGMYFDQESIVDRMTLDFTLPAAFDGFVFGVLNKSVMRYQRIANWDLQFTKTNDAPFSNSFVIMTETAEVSEKILNKEMIQIITDMSDSLEYIVISDQPCQQPKSSEQDKSIRNLRVSILLGSASATSSNLNMLIATILDLADNLPKQALKISSNGQKKLALAREDTYKLIGKQLALEAAEDAPKRLTRKEIREKEKRESIGKLSAKDQKKALEKERERALKKGQSKMSRKA